jgi:hypothetical protein
MQSAAIIAIGRVFDQGSHHNLDKLLRLAQSNLSMFSKEALARRKQGDAPQPPSWLEQYLADAYVPVPPDFRKLRGHVKKHRSIYDANYRDLRHKVYAHKEAADGGETKRLVAKTTIREIERLLLFLLRIYNSLWHLLMNGRKPTLGRVRYAVNREGGLSQPRTTASGVHRRMVREVEEVLTRAAAAQRPSDRVNRRVRKRRRRGELHSLGRSRSR